MNYINNIPLINDDNDDLLKSLIPSMDNFIESINTINNDTDSSYSCDPYTNNFHEGHVNINYLIKELKCNKELNVFFFDYTNYSIAKNIQPHQVYNPIFIDNYKEIEIDIAKSIPFSYMHYSGKRINTRLRVALNKRKCFLDLSDPGYVFNMKKDNPSFEIRFPYKDAVDKRDYSITPGIENDFRLLPKYNGIIIKATTVNDFLEVCKRIGNYHFALKRISEKYVEALLDNKTGSELNYLYENLPYSVIEYSKNNMCSPYLLICMGLGNTIMNNCVKRYYNTIYNDQSNRLTGNVDVQNIT